MVQQPQKQCLDGAVALVTGAAGGLGQAEVHSLAESGAQVLAHARCQSAELEELCLRTGATPLIRDLETPDGCRALIAEAAEFGGRLDILVANHATMSMSPLTDADMDEWWRVVDTNLVGSYALIQAAVVSMRSHRKGGRIVVVSSEWGVTGWPNATAYAASKAGLISLVKCLGRELGPEGIYVNAVAPGVIDTPQLAVDAEAAGLELTDMHKEYARSIPMGRIGKPIEVAEVVTFLASPGQGSILGQTIQINGGNTRNRV